ncbi:unnamed protein product [Musa acuminata subsp. burmannicoides]
MKYRHCDGKLILKVTDNREALLVHGTEGMFLVKSKYISRTALAIFKVAILLCHCCFCLKFRTDQAQNARKMEKLNNIFFTLMVSGPDADISEASGKEQAEQPASKKGRGRRQ